MKIDKSSPQWKKLPLWVRIGMLGLPSLSAARKLELFSVAAGVLGSVMFLKLTNLAQLSMLLFFIGAYWLSAAGRHIEKQGFN